jgi:hypothetical protein
MDGMDEEIGEGWMDDWNWMKEGGGRYYAQMVGSSKDQDKMGLPGRGGEGHKADRSRVGRSISSSSSYSSSSTSSASSSIVAH